MENTIQTCRHTLQGTQHTQRYPRAHTMKTLNWTGEASSCTLVQPGHSRPSPKFGVKAPWSSQAPNSLQPAKGPCHLHVGTHRHHDPCSPTLTGRHSAGGLTLYTHSNTHTHALHTAVHSVAASSTGLHLVGRGTPPRPL